MCSIHSHSKRTMSVKHISDLAQRGCTKATIPTTPSMDTHTTTTTGLVSVCAAPHPLHQLEPNGKGNRKQQHQAELPWHHVQHGFNGQPSVRPYEGPTCQLASLVVALKQHSKNSSNGMLACHPTKRNTLTQANQGWHNNTDHCRSLCDRLDSESLNRVHATHRTHPSTQPVTWREVSCAPRR